MDERGSKVDFGALIASALKAALVGAITAPLERIGSVIGGDAAEDGGFALDPLPSQPGTAELAGDGQDRVDGLAATLAQRPQIGLALRGRVGQEDRPLVAEQILLERWQGLPELADASFLARRRLGRALSRRAQGEPLGLEAEDEPLYEQYVTAVEAPDERLAKLATARAERRATLVAKGVVAARVAVGDPEAESKPGVVVGFRAGSRARPGASALRLVVPFRGCAGHACRPRPAWRLLYFSHAEGDLPCDASAPRHIPPRNSRGPRAGSTTRRTIRSRAVRRRPSRRRVRAVAPLVRGVAGPGRRPPLRRRRAAAEVRGACAPPASQRARFAPPASASPSTTRPRSSWESATSRRRVAARSSPSSATSRSAIAPSTR
jgi:hypothetical protein